MGKLKTSLSFLLELIKEELHDVKPLSGNNLNEFKNALDIDEDLDVEIYYNSYNVVISDKSIYDKLSCFLPDSSLVFKVEIPEHGRYLFVHQYFNCRLLEDYLL